MSANIGPGAVKFVALDAIGLPVKRKQVAHACEACRRKKKRCGHAPQPASTNSDGHGSEQCDESNRNTRPKTSDRASLSSAYGPLPLPALRTPPHTSESGGEAEDVDSEAAASQLLELSSRRFVGDMNPESVLLQATTPRLKPGEPYRDQSDLGVWIPPLPQTITGDSPDAGVPSLGSPPSLEGPQKYHHSSRSAITQSYERIRRGYLQECLGLLPPKEDYEALKAIFVEKLHPIFPVFNDEDLHVEKPTTPYLLLVRQIIALSAAADVRASEHLRLEPGGRLLGFTQFHQRLSAAVFTIIDAAVLGDKIQFVRINAMMAMFYQPANASQRNKAACLCGQTVHALQTVGAHLSSYRPQSKSENIQRLYCAVWALDLLCNGMNARPVNMHERDTDIDVEKWIAKQPPAFRLFMMIAVDLNKVMNLYRPREKFKVIDIQVLEMMMVEAGAEKLPTTILGTLEVFYHAVSVLSCRQPSSSYTESSARHDFSYIPQAPINARLSLSADRIVWVAQNQEFCPFPFVPYAVSLALSVQYRKMRYSQTAMFRNRARGIFRDIVGLLASMGDVYSSARVNAKLGESILHEMGKTASTLARDDGEGSGTSRTAEGAPAETRPRAAAAANTTVSNALPSAPDMSGTGTAAMLGGGSFSDPNIGATVALQDSSNAPVPTGTGALVDYTILDNLDMDVDLFGYFDPNFDLGAVDTALEANLDMGFPQDWMSCWSQLGS